jgi:hypothetical protein
MVMVKHKEHDLQIGDRVLYNGEQYWIVSPEFQGLIEIAPTLHGAGGFVVLVDRILRID